MFGWSSLQPQACALKGNRLVDVLLIHCNPSHNLRGATALAQPWLWSRLLLYSDVKAVFLHSSMARSVYHRAAPLMPQHAHA